MSDLEMWACPDGDEHRRWEYLGSENSGPVMVMSFRCLICGHERQENLDFSGLTLNLPNPHDAHVS